MKISLITVVYNGERFLEDCIKSVIKQSYTDIEYILIDGASTDNTADIIKKYADFIDKTVSDKDEGLYDAINKGINLATGDVIGLLNADDMLADGEVISGVMSLFGNDLTLDAVYGDLNYVQPLTLKIIRKWRSKQADKKDLSNGWMPAHPTLYVKKKCFRSYGNYVLSLGTAADYDLILRFLYVHGIKIKYMPKLMVNMRIGGVSNSGVMAILLAAKNDFRALKRNHVPFPLWVLLKKKLNKLEQFI